MNLSFSEVLNYFFLMKLPVPLMKSFMNRHITLGSFMVYESWSSVLNFFWEFANFARRWVIQTRIILQQNSQARSWLKQLAQATCWSCDRSLSILRSFRFSFHSLLRGRLSTCHLFSVLLCTCVSYVHPTECTYDAPPSSFVLSNFKFEAGTAINQSYRKI